MTKIRPLYYFDKKYAREMISFLNDDVLFINNIVFNPLAPLYHLLPLSLKSFPESYVLKENKEMKGLITVAPAKTPTKQMEIQQLLFEDNCYGDAEEMIQYVVSKYKAMGTASIIVRIDDYLSDLIRTFVSKCGFSQISYEKLWQLKENNNLSLIDFETKFNPKLFRSYRNSDAQLAATLYDDELLPNIRPLLGKDTKEFKDEFFKGLSYITEYKYVYCDYKTKRVYAFLFIRSTDNKNFVLDIINSAWDDINIEEIVSFAYYQIKKRTKDAKLFVKTKKYVQQNEKIEKELIDNNYECIQNKVVLTNSSMRVIKNEVQEKKYTVLGQFYSGLSITNKSEI